MRRSPGTAIDLLVGPLVAGWMGLAVLASATHLVPAVGPGGPRAHGRQRRILGRGAIASLAIANLGIASVAAGLPLSLHVLVMVGVVAVALSLGGTAVLVAAAVVVGLRDIRVPRAGPC